MIRKSCYQISLACRGGRDLPSLDSDFQNFPKRPHFGVIHTIHPFWPTNPHFFRILVNYTKILRGSAKEVLFNRFPKLIKSAENFSLTKFSNVLDGFIEKLSSKTLKRPLFKKKSKRWKLSLKLILAVI